MKSQASDVFRVLGVTTRLGILELLKTEGPSPVKTIAQRLGITPAAVSQHLKALRYAGLVKSERQGYWVPYSVDEEALERCCGMMIQVCTVAAAGTEEGASSSGEKEALVQRKRVLEAELQRVEKKLTELKATKK
jgi:DNA-binding transcriptional ArsR family regulator